MRITEKSSKIKVKLKIKSEFKIVNTRGDKITIDARKIGTVSKIKDLQEHIKEIKETTQIRNIKIQELLEIDNLLDIVAIGCSDDDLEYIGRLIYAVEDKIKSNSYVQRLEAYAKKNPDSNVSIYMIEKVEPTSRSSFSWLSDKDGTYVVVVDKELAVYFENELNHFFKLVESLNNMIKKKSSEIDPENNNTDNEAIKKLRDSYFDGRDMFKYIELNTEEVISNEDGEIIWI